MVQPSSATAGEGRQRCYMVIPIRIGMYGAFGRMGQIIMRTLLSGFGTRS